MHLPINSTLQAGKYKIVRFISAGGFGCTYEAIHTGFDERVAIKEFFVKDFCNRDEETAHVTIGTTSKVALVKKLQKKFVEEARQEQLRKEQEERERVAKQERERQEQLRKEQEKRIEQARQDSIRRVSEQKRQNELNAKTFTVKGVSFTMAFVKGGTFNMGATSEQGSDADFDEKPVHQVTLSSYYIGKYEVTQDLWQAVMGSNPSYYKGSRRPAECVSWDDCRIFINKLNTLTGKRFRLPTEAEWEFAARGGNNSRGYKYSGSNSSSDVAWYYDNSGSTTHDVGTKSPNELGIYDMSGNVFEWCLDWYGNYSSSSQTNPTGASSGSFRVNRGGSWGSHARGCRSSYRNRSTPSGRHGSIGLRLVLVP